MKYKHNWEIVPPAGEYDSLHRCTICNADNMESIDNPISKNPVFGCIPLEDQKHTRLIPLETKEGFIDLPNGGTLYWETNKAGGRTYTSDEIGIGVLVWDTALIDNNTLLAAIVQEASLNRVERYWDEKREKNKSK